MIFSHRARVLLWTLVLVFVSLWSCSREPDSTPEGALSAWVSAMNASRSDIQARRRAYDLLTTRAQQSLAERASRATQLSGRELQPWEMLAPGRFSLRFPFDPETLSSTIEGETAVVLARSRGGERAEVPMVRENGRWRVDLSLPPIRPIRAGEASEEE
jgi:hypothetical protein